MMLAAFLAVVGSLRSCSVAGSLDGSASTATVTGASQPLTVPAGNPGNIELSLINNTMTLSVNGGAFGSGPFTGVLDGQSIQARTTLAPGDFAQAQLFDSTTHTLIKTITLNRT